MTKFEVLPQVDGIRSCLPRPDSPVVSPGRQQKLNKLDHGRTRCFSVRHWMAVGGNASPTSSLCDRGCSWRAPRRRRGRRSAPHAVPSGGGDRREGGRRRLSSPVAFLMPPASASPQLSPCLGPLCLWRRRCYSDCAAPTGEAARSKVARVLSPSRRAPKGQGAHGAESLRQKERDRTGPRMTRRRR